MTLIDYRDELAYKRLLGRRLTLWQRIALFFLNTALDLYMSRHYKPAKNKRLRKTLRDARRLLKAHRR